MRRRGAEEAGAIFVKLNRLDGTAEPHILNLRQVREEAERNAVLRVLGRVNGNLSKAAELLGVSRPTLYDLMHRFGLKQTGLADHNS